VGAWQSPGYQGFMLAGYTAADAEAGIWYGVRCDDWVVIDCDSDEAAQEWLKIDDAACPTWMRKTPHGQHFIYRWTEGSPTGPSAGIMPLVDIRAGRTSQIVFYAPGYSDITQPSEIRSFRPEWLTGYAPERGVERDDESWDEIPDGRGNNTMTAFAGVFRKQGMSLPAMAKCLGAINRICMTDDPMPVDMVVQIVKSVGRYAAKPDIDIVVED
jgi:hypothetical protein